MSVRFDAVTDYLSRTTDVPNYNALYTVMFWGKVAVDINNYGHFVALCATATEIGGDYYDSDFLGTDEDGTTFRCGAYTNATGNIFTGAALAVGPWYHFAMVRESATLLRGYLNGTSQGTSSQSVVSRTAVLGEFWGRFNGAYEINGNVAYIKAWTRALSQPEIAREMREAAPVSTVRLHTVVSASSALRLQNTARHYGRGVPTGYTANGALTTEVSPHVFAQRSARPVLGKAATAAAIFLPPLITAPYRPY
jgi:hypothetical protein